MTAAVDPAAVPSERDLLEELETHGISRTEPLYRFTALLARCMAAVMATSERLSAQASASEEAARVQAGATMEVVGLEVRQAIGAQVGAALRRLSWGGLAAGLLATACIGSALVGGGYLAGHAAAAGARTEASAAVQAALRSGPGEAEEWAQIIVLNRLRAALARGRCWDKDGGQACQFTVWTRPPTPTP